MRPTKYFKNATEMTAFAKDFASVQPNWYLRTTLQCDHVLNEKRKAIVLISKESLVRSLIVCSTCNRNQENNVSTHQ